MPTDTIRLNLACTCGARWHGTLGPNAADAVEAVWKREHTGEGHGPCDAKTAGRIRATQLARERAAEYRREMTEAEAERNDAERPLLEKD